MACSPCNMPNPASQLHLAPSCLACSISINYLCAVNMCAGVELYLHQRICGRTAIMLPATF